MNIGSAIILIIVAAIAGYVVGIIDSRITKSIKEKVDQAAEEKKAAEEPKKVDEHIVLKVSIDPATKWLLDLDGVRVEPAGMTAEQRTRLVNTIIQIRPWIDAKPASALQPPKPADAPAPRPVPAPTPSPVTAAASSPTSLASSNAPTTPPPRVDFLRGMRSLLQNDIKKTEPPPIISIVAMIDEVLQKKLAGTPLADKKIRLEEGAIGEVVVFIDKERYPGIDSVPDEQIKAIIRAAITEWEKK